MLRTTLQHNAKGALDLIQNVKAKSIKSSHYYEGYSDWLINKFIPSYNSGNSSIITTHCKCYDTLIGFCLLKHDSQEVKISNLSPLVDGVGITQSLLDGCEFVLDRDYDIYVPSQASDLLDKLQRIGFHHVEQCVSTDGTFQHKLTKPRNISWL